MLTEKSFIPCFFLITRCNTLGGVIKISLISGKQYFCENRREWSGMKYCVGQKVCLGFSISFYGKSQTNLLANPIQLNRTTDSINCALYTI